MQIQQIQSTVFEEDKWASAVADGVDRVSGVECQNYEQRTAQLAAVLA